MNEPLPKTLEQVEATVRPDPASAPARLSWDGPDAQDLTTGAAPSFRALLPNTDVLPPPAPLILPQPGQRLKDFEILQVLGSGAFATVFLARQISLDRQVALKVSANRGNEGRTIASLEHDHIVRVFSEDVDREGNLRLLCMQYVSGTTLERVIQTLRHREPQTWSGQAVLDAIDARSTDPALFDPAALRDREALAGCDFAEAVCWLGVRLAEALAHAHNQGVFHRDVKPANILLNRYGRPLLADFNVALDRQRVRGPAGAIFGGTLAYMAPEHIDAFNPGEPFTPEVVDARSDVYSLGLVLFELLTGRLPFPVVLQAETTAEALRGLADQRRMQAPSPRKFAEVPEVLDRIVRRCLDPEPEGRYQTAAELAQALTGCGEHRRATKALPPGHLLTPAAARHPFLLGAVLLLIPHVLGSIVNISYNSLRIAGQLTQEQQAAFAHLVLGYNLIVYPVCLWLMCRLVAPIYRGVRELAGPIVPDREHIAALRRRLLILPLWTVGLACVGWLPGGILFPLGIDLLSGGVPEGVYGHFVLSFTMSGLIALTYSVLVCEFIGLRILYPQFWVDARGFRERTQTELRGEAWRLYILQLFAGIIPLAGACLMVAVGPETLITPASYRTFRVLVTGLIALGMLGFGVALSASDRLRQTLHALIGGPWKSEKRVA